VTMSWVGACAIAAACSIHGHKPAAPSLSRDVRVSVVRSRRANTGLKGEDFNRNLYIKTLDFATIHVYPQSFGLSNTSYQDVNEFYVGEHHPRQACSSVSQSFACHGSAVHMLLARDACWRLLRAYTQSLSGLQGTG
jgi:hypothetical protein